MNENNVYYLVVNLYFYKHRKFKIPYFKKDRDEMQFTLFSSPYLKIGIKSFECYLKIGKTIS